MTDNRGALAVPEGIASSFPEKMRPYRLTPVNAEQAGERTSDVGVALFGGVVFLAVFCIVAGVGFVVTGGIGFAVVIPALVIAALAASSMRIAQQWERVVVQRFGRFNRVVSPGLFFIIPVIEQIAMRVDCRVRTSTFGAEDTLSSDLVPLTVDAVLLWSVHDAKAACNEVSDFARTVQLLAQAYLRDALGRLTASQIAIRREQLDREIKEDLENECAQWGISVLSVKVRDIVLPPELQDVMSQEAQAEQRCKARVALMEVEQDIADMAGSVGEVYGGGDAALRLRAMHMLYESVRETGGTIVVPSSFSEGFGDILPDKLNQPK